MQLVNVIINLHEKTRSIDMKNLVLGLDIGITSVGYGVIDLDDGRFVDYGVRLFKEGTAEENLKRRTARSRRRLLTRRKTRISDMKNVLKEYDIMHDDYRPLSNVYELRCKGLTQKLTNNELTSVILHITKHRGSVVETVEEDVEKSKDFESLKAILAKNKQMMKQGKYICEIQMERLLNELEVRGHSNNFSTKDYVNELCEILNHQDVCEDAKQKILALIQRKRAYYEGPGSEKSPTPYGCYIEVNGQIEKIDLIEKMRGKCSVFPDEPRAPKMSISADLFNFLNDLNNLTVQEEKLTTQEKEQVLSIIDKKGNVTLKQLAKLFEVEESDIRGYRIDKNEKPLFTEFKGYKKLKKLFSEAGYSISLQDYEFLDDVIEILTKKKGIEERKNAFKQCGREMSDSLLHMLANMTGIVGYHSMSLKAIRLLNKELFETGMNQMQLLHDLKLFDKYRKSYKGKESIEADTDAILSPVTKRAQNETFKVINALRKKYGEFASIVVEMARDKNSDERKKRINQFQKKKENSQKEMDSLLKERGFDPDKINGKTRMKISLYLQQDGKSAYTLQPLDLDRVIKDATYTEIDHIIPISISLDDSQNNKALILRSENQMKGNLTPFMAYQAGKLEGCTYDKYKAVVLANKQLPYKKKMNLLNEKDITKIEVRKDFINRNLVDTRYACRVVLNTLSKYFKDNGLDTKVHVVNGRLTDLFRKKIQLDKDRSQDFLHHAIDALIVASIKKLNLLNEYLLGHEFKEIYNEETGEIHIPNDSAVFDEKYIRYILDLKMIYQESNQYYYHLLDKKDMHVKPIKISHKINTKANRQIANETIYSTRNRDGIDYLVEKIPDIYDPKSKRCKDLVESILNNDDQKYLMARNDPQTFSIVREIIQNHYSMYQQDEKIYGMKNGKIELKGENPLTKYKEEHGVIKKYSKKDNGPAIISMKYESEKLGNHLPISQNYDSKNKKVILKQLSPYRTDFYRCKDGKFRIVTIYYINVKYDKVKDKFFISKKWYEDEMKKKKIKQTDEFLFSLHRDELIGIVQEEGKLLYYDASTEGKGEKQYSDGKQAQIWKFTATNNDKKNKIEIKPIFTYCKKQLMPSIASVVDLKKFSTDVLGNLYENKQNVLKLEFD